MNNIYIDNKNNAVFENNDIYQKILNQTLKTLDIKKNSEVNVIIIDNNQMKDISKQYKGIDKTTDVLSFPSEWEKLSEMIGYNMFGDIFISSEKVKLQAIDYNHSVRREWSYLFVHGLLHLIGYDHMNEKDEKEMNDLAKIILEKVGVSRDD